MRRPPLLGSGWPFSRSRPGGPGIAAQEAAGSPSEPLREKRDIGVGEELVVADHAVSAVVLARPAAASADGVLADQQG